MVKVTVKHLNADEIIASGHSEFYTLQREFNAVSVETKIDSNAWEIMVVIHSMGKRYAYNLAHYSITIE